jgi:hypothetical protein
MKLTELTDKLNFTFEAQGGKYTLANSEQADTVEVKNVIAYSFLLDILTIERQSEYSLAVSGQVFTWNLSVEKETKPKKAAPAVSRKGHEVKAEKEKLTK